LRSRRKGQLHELVQELESYIQKKNLGNIKVSATSANGFAEDAIAEIAEKYKPGIVIMGTHGIGEQTQGIFGSVTSRLIDRLTVPLLTIPAAATYQGIGKIKTSCMPLILMILITPPSTGSSILSARLT
jgi:nucleotide-binding universal stress UspA family protein